VTGSLNFALCKIISDLCEVYHKPLLRPIQDLGEDMENGALKSLKKGIHLKLAKFLQFFVVGIRGNITYHHVYFDKPCLLHLLPTV
jgi:hypothetical protein